LETESFDRPCINPIVRHRRRRRCRPRRHRRRHRRRRHLLMVRPIYFLSTQGFPVNRTPRRLENARTLYQLLRIYPSIISIRSHRVDRTYTCIQTHLHSHKSVHYTGSLRNHSPLRHFLFIVASLGKRLLDVTNLTIVNIHRECLIMTVQYLLYLFMI